MIVNNLLKSYPMIKNNGSAANNTSSNAYYLQNSEIKCILISDITFYYTKELSIDVTASYILLPRAEYRKKAVNLRLDISRYWYSYLIYYFGEDDIRYLLRAIEHGWVPGPAVVTQFLDVLNIEERLVIYPYNRESDIRSIQNENDSLLRTLITSIEDKNNASRVMPGILIHSILYLHEKNENFLSSRIDWSALGPKIRQLGNASRKELEKKVYVDINWGETTELNTNNILRNLIEQHDYRFALFGDLDFFVSVADVQGISYQKA
ncbi:hypothetical protein M951_chr2159 (nucleomorph) [Lotharella oceanica]|uniref:Uncharacterized protein n=1 Tax=Lotharella oceanica TaxID=641309 RepID=A0A060DFR2_9EUKA|nr:hypothetical protein M951_chr1179 [Lotharella oceanica]AIB09853.1 hypothetical protein M951_chr2159 [Lotharella oceanica]